MREGAGTVAEWHPYIREVQILFAFCPAASAPAVCVLSPQCRVSSSNASPTAAYSRSAFPRSLGPRSRSLLTGSSAAAVRGPYNLSLSFTYQGRLRVEDQ